MEFVRKDLLSAIKTAGRGVSARSSREILTAVKMSVRDGKAQLLGTDMEVAVTAEISVEGSDFDVMLPMKTQEILAGLWEDTVQVDRCNGGVAIRTDRYEVTLQSYDPSEFPPFVDANNQPFPVQGLELADGLKAVSWAAGDANTHHRFALGGVRFESGDRLELCATNTSVMGVSSISGVLEFVPGVVPMNAVRAIQAILVDNEAYMTFMPSHIAVKCGPAMVQSRLLEGNFPNWRKAIPQGEASVATVDFALLKSVISQAMTIQDPERKGFCMWFDSNRIRLESKTGDFQIHAVCEPCDHVFLNPNGIQEFLQSIPKCGEVRVELRSSDSPVVLESGAHRAVIMTMEEPK